MPQLSLESEDEIIAMYNGGMTGGAVAAEMGIDVTTVYKVLRRRGVPRRPSGAGSKYDVTAIVDAYLDIVVDKGGKVQDVIDQFKVTHAQLYSWLRQYDIPLANQIKTPAREERDQLAVEMYKEGWKIMEICAQLRIDAPQLYILLNRAGVPKRRRVEEEGMAKNVERVRELMAQRKADEKAAKLERARLAHEAEQRDQGQAEI